MIVGRWASLPVTTGGLEGEEERDGGGPAGIDSPQVDQRGFAVRAFKRWALIGCPAW